MSNSIHSRHLAASWAGPNRWLTLDNLTLAPIALVLGYSAMYFGGVEGASQFVLALLVTLLTLILVARWLWDPAFRVVPTLVWVPLALIILLAVAQLVPLPHSLVSLISPARTAASAPLVEGDVAPPLLTLSAASHETRHSLRLAVMAALVLMAVTSYVRDKTHLQQLLVVVFAVGCLEAAVAIAQIITGADKLFWSVDAGQGGMMTAGSFVNHSHFSQHVNLAIGAGVGLLLMRLQQAERRRGQFDEAFHFTPREILTSQGWILLGLAACVFAVCLSLSRNGILSLVIAMAVAGGLLAHKKHLGWQGWLLAIVPLAVFGLLLLFGLNSFYDRLATLEEGHHYVDRWALTLASFKAGWQYALLGAGLGTYGLVFPPFDNTGSASVAAYADNDYAQVFVEGGFAGMAILTIFATVVAYYGFKLLRIEKSSTAQVAFGLLVGLMAIAIHSATDFGQRIPGVFLMTVTSAGLLSTLPGIISRSRDRQAGQATHDRPKGWSGWGGRTVVSLTLLGTSAWMVVGAYDHYQAENWWAATLKREAPLREAEWDGTDEEYQHLLVAAENCVAWEPDNGRMQYWLNFYRWMAINRSETVESVGGELPPEWREVFDQLVRELAAVRAMIPTYAPAFLLEGQLRGYVLGDTEAGEKLLANAARLAIGNPQVQFVYGQWAAQRGKENLAHAHLERALKVDGRYYANTARLLINHFGDTSTAREWAGSDLGRLEVLARVLTDQPEYAELLAEVEGDANQLLRDLAASDAASTSQLLHLAESAVKARDHETAVDYYRKALGKQYRLTKARIGLARSLRALGRFEEALNEAKICLRQEPRNSQAKALAETLALEVRPDSPSQ